MSLSLTSQPVELGLPLGGIHTNTSLVSLPAQYSPEMLNFHSEGSYLKTRNGVRLHSTISGYKEVCTLFSYIDSSGAEKLIGATRNSSGHMTVVDFTSSTGTLGATITTATGYDINPQIFANGEDVVLIHNKTTSGFVTFEFQVYDVSAGSWSIFGWFTVITPTGKIPYGVTKYKGRQYILFYDTSIFSYSDVGATSGTIASTRQVDLSQFTRTSARLRCIIPFSLSDGAGSDEALAFVFSSGEVLVYQGQYPTSPDWGLIGQFVIPKPVGLNKWVQVNRDAYLMTVSGLISMRDLVIGGVDSANVSTLSFNVDRDWRSAYTGTTEASNERIHSSICYSVDRQKIYCYLGTSASTKSYIYVYDLLSKGWYLHQLPQLSTNSGQNAYTPRSMCVHKGSIYIAGNDGKVWEYEKASTYSDENYASAGANVGFTATIKTAPIAVSGTNATKKVNGVSTVASGNVNKLKTSLIANFGQKTSGEATQSSTATSIQDLYYSVGVEGKYEQIQYSVSSSDVLTTDLKIYAQGVSFEQGGQR